MLQRILFIGIIAVTMANGGTLHAETTCEAKCLKTGFIGEQKSCKGEHLPQPKGVAKTTAIRMNRQSAFLSNRK